MQTIEFNFRVNMNNLNAKQRRELKIDYWTLHCTAEQKLFEIMFSTVNCELQTERLR